MLARHFELASQAIRRHGGSVEKYIGDAVMAVFGVPDLHEDDALRALRAASELRDGTSALNEELAREFGVRLAVRVGINTGEVVAGDASAGQALVTGEPVVTAARLEQAATPGRSSWASRRVASPRTPSASSHAHRSISKAKMSL